MRDNLKVRYLKKENYEKLMIKFQALRRWTPTEIGRAPFESEEEHKQRLEEYASIANIRSLRYYGKKHIIEFFSK